MKIRPQAAWPERYATPLTAANEDGRRETAIVVELGRRRQPDVRSGDPDKTCPPAVARSQLLRLVELVFTWLDRVRQRRQLGAFSDSMLKDIGLSRADVDYETRRRFWQN